jgi:3-oxoacyl-[acyl-carrier protein] reductase
MIPRREGHIVNIASVAGMRGAVGSAEYGAAKAGLMNLTMTAAKELASFGITVNAVAPSMVATKVNSELKDKGSRFIASALEGTPDGSLVAPEKIAALVAFLCSDAASHINGVTIPIDGGASIAMSTDAYMLRSLGKRSAFLEEAGDADSD